MFLKFIDSDGATLWVNKTHIYAYTEFYEKDATTGELAKEATGSYVVLPYGMLQVKDTVEEIHTKVNQHESKVYPANYN